MLVFLNIQEINKILNFVMCNFYDCANMSLWQVNNQFNLFLFWKRWIWMLFLINIPYIFQTSSLFFTDALCA